jgi:hypothetical protein
VSGPFEPFDVSGLLSKGLVEHVRDEVSIEWVPWQQSPFGQNPAAAVVPSATKPTVQLRPVHLLFGFVVLMAVGISANNGWVGLVLGLALSAWAVRAHAHGKATWVGLVLKKPPALRWTFASAALGMSFAALGIGRLAIDRGQRAAAVARAATAEAAQRERAEARISLERQLPGLLRAWRDQLGDALRGADSESASEGLRRTALVRDAVDAYYVRLGPPLPVELTALGRDIAAQSQALASRKALADQVAAVDSQMTLGKDAAKRQDWLAADAAYEAAITAIVAVEGTKAELVGYIPKAFEGARKRSEIQVLRASIAGPVTREKKRLAAEQAKERAHQIYLAVCGPAPGMKPGDNERTMLQMRLEATANDPDSIKIVQCSEPVLSEKACWRTSCDIRGKNAFGALILQEKFYSFSKAGFEEVKAAAQ